MSTKIVDNVKDIAERMAELSRERLEQLLPVEEKPTECDNSAVKDYCGFGPIAPQMWLWPYGS